MGAGISTDGMSRRATPMGLQPHVAVLGRTNEMMAHGIDRASRAEYVEAALDEEIHRHRHALTKVRALPVANRRRQREIERRLRVLIGIRDRADFQYEEEGRRLHARFMDATAWMEQQARAEGIWEEVIGHVDMAHLRDQARAMRLAERADAMTAAKAEQDRWDAA